jgi:hypothetical protein
MFKSTMHVFAILFITATLAKAAVPRAIDADVIKSSDHTKTWVMPGVSGTFANTSDITSAVNAHEADTTNVHGIADTSLLLTTSTGLQKSNNLSDVSNAGTSRTNLGLGTMATQNSNGLVSPVVLSQRLITTVERQVTHLVLHSRKTRRQIFQVLLVSKGHLSTIRLSTNPFTITDQT